MKASLFLIAAALCAGALAAPSASSQREILHLLQKSCQEKVGATEDELKGVQDMTKFHLETTGAKKIVACAMKEDKMIVDGKFSPEGALEVARKWLEDEPDMEKKMEVAKEITQKCGVEINSSPASSDEDLAKDILECFWKHEKLAGVQLFEN